MGSSFEIYYSCRSCHNEALVLCSRCLASTYCSKKCLKEDWASHRHWCTKDENIDIAYAKRQMQSCLELISFKELFKCLIYQKHLSSAKPEPLILLVSDRIKKCQAMLLPVSYESFKEAAVALSVDRSKVEELIAETMKSLSVSEATLPEIKKIGIPVLYFAEKVNVYVIGSSMINGLNKEINRMPDEALSLVLSAKFQNEQKSTQLEPRKTNSKKVKKKPSQKNTRAFEALG